MLLQRLVLFVALVLLTTSSSGCADRGSDSGAPASAAAVVLRASFPEQAAKVLEQEEAFVAAPQGFALGAPSSAGTWRGLEVELPPEGSGAILFRTARGFEVQVREIGLEGQGALAEQSVAYRQAGGRSFWTVVPGGVEEWLHLEAGVARNGEAVAAWEIEGAAVKQAGEAVEVVDAGGVVRMRVTAPIAYAAGGREVEARLWGQGTRIELRVDADGEEVLVDPLWVPTGSMSVERYSHSAMLLQDGTVLVVGGTFVQYGELYHPATGTWTLGASMSIVRYYDAATLLQDGTVLVEGGVNTDGHHASAERYNPVTDTWTAAASMSATRTSHTATLLQDGTVLVVGGFDDDLNPLASAERYNPATDTWTAAASMSAARLTHTATRLQDGTVLVAGGGDDVNSQSSAERYNPATDTWTATALMSAGASAHTATLLQDGTVLRAGGNDSMGSVASAERYNPATDTWTTVPSLSGGRYSHTATLLQDGTVLVAGGYEIPQVPLASAERYNPATDTWTVVASMSANREGHTATLLQDSSVLVAGGDLMGSAERYLAGLGSPCTQPSDCPIGSCVDGVCCDTACNAGACDACSIAAGAPADGTCALLTGPACDDGNGCTQSDTCEAGACAGTNPVDCPAPTPCQDTGACDPLGGMCASLLDKPDGTACVGGTCANGACLPDGSGDEDEDQDESGGCGCKVGPGAASTPGAPWVGLGLLLLVRRRLARGNARACTRSRRAAGKRRG